MEFSKSSSSNNDDDNFFDTADEFPFYDCVCSSEPDQSISQSSSIPQLERIEANTSPEVPSPAGIRRRRSFSQHIGRVISGDESKDANYNSSVSSDVNDMNTAAATTTVTSEGKYRFSLNLKENESESKKLDPFKARLSSGGIHNRLKEESKVNSMVTSDSNDMSTADTTTTVPRERTYKFSRNLKENGSGSENLDPFNVRFSAGGIHNRLKVEIKENSTVTTANNEKIYESITVDSHSGVVEESSSNFLFLLAGFVIKGIEFQINLLVSLFAFPIWLLYCSYMFMVDPFRAVRCGREYLMLTLFKIWRVIYESVTTFIYEWLKGYNSILNLALRFWWGLLWVVYICSILVSLLVAAFVTSGFMTRFLVEVPIQMKETMNLDYTKNSPVAFVPIISCSASSCGVNCTEKIEVGNLGAPRVIPPNHKVQVTVSLTLPESDYNRNLGIFQVSVDFLSVHGIAVASSSHPCMLQFKSQPVRLLLTFLKIAPLVAGYSSESQTLNIKFNGFTEGDIPTACLRVMVEQRAEFRPGAGVPEIYAASLSLESEFNLLKRILWNWKKMIFIWISMVMFTMEFLLILLFCRPFVIPRVKLRGGSANSGALQNNPPVQRKHQAL